jgi:hypothetical protein
MSDHQDQSNPTKSQNGGVQGNGQRQIQELIEAFSATQNNQIEQTSAPTADPAVLSAYQGLVDGLAGPADTGIAFQMPPPAYAPWNVSDFDFVGPTVDPGTPGRGARDVARNIVITATFSEDMEKTSLADNARDSATFTLIETSTLKPVKAKVDYTDRIPGGASPTASPTAKLTPSSTLKEGTNYTVVIRGGTGGVTDRFGNPLTENEIWNFTTTTQP